MIENDCWVCTVLPAEGSPMIHRFKTYDGEWQGDAIVSKPRVLGDKWPFISAKQSLLKPHCHTRRYCTTHLHEHRHKATV